MPPAIAKGRVVGGAVPLAADSEYRQREGARADQGPAPEAVAGWVGHPVARVQDVVPAASPNPVSEGSPVTVTATLTAALGSDVTALTAGTAEAGDYGPLASITRRSRRTPS